VGNSQIEIGSGLYFYYLLVKKEKRGRVLFDILKAIFAIQQQTTIPNRLFFKNVSLPFYNFSCKKFYNLFLIDKPLSNIENIALSGGSKEAKG